MPSSPKICLNKMLGQFPTPGIFEFHDAASHFLAASGHAPTPLHHLPNAALKFGIGSLYIKDESKVMGQTAFKIRGAAWALAKICCQKFAMHSAPANLQHLREALAGTQLLLVSATDGNHGVAVAALAQTLGQSAVIFMPKGSAQARINAIIATGNQCIVTSSNYDETVNLAHQFAEDNACILIQDTAWPGYEEIPLWIMEGYATIAYEIGRQAAYNLPTHVFLQAGVGSFAASIIQAFNNLALAYRRPVPKFICLEPDAANCIYRSIQAADGKSRVVTGEMTTVMDGLACGRPSSLAWPILRNFLAATVSCPDWLAIQAVDRMGHPVPGDPAIASGFSAAPGYALMQWLIENPSPYRSQLGLETDSRVLIISTEGATSSC